MKSTLLIAAAAWLSACSAALTPPPDQMDRVIRALTLAAELALRPAPGSVQ